MKESDVELHKVRSEAEVLKSEIQELKDKISSHEEKERNSNEVSIKTELNTFESLLECEGYFIIYYSAIG